MKHITCLLILLSLIVIIIGLPQFTPKQLKTDELPKDFTITDNSADTVANATATDIPEKKFNYASIQSQIIATSLLKDNMDIDGNHIYSPLGISSILAVLAEGSRGDTYKEYVTALGYPENKTELRESFKQIFDNFHQKPLDFSEDNTSPTFKTWLYIYRNNTARQEFKDILKNCYSVEVKDINRTEYDWNVPDTAIRSVENSNETNIIGSSGLQSDKESIREPVNSKDVLNFEDLKKSEPFDNEENVAVSVPAKIEIIKLDDNLTPEVVDSTVNLIKVASKFDSVVEDKQYVEVPIIKAEIAKQALDQEKQKQEQESRKTDDMMLIEEMIELKDKSAENENIENNKSDKIENINVNEIIELRNDENDEFNVEDNETIKDDEKLEELRKHVDSKNEIIIEYVKESSNEPQKIVIPIENLNDDGDTMEAAESRHFKQRFTRSRTLLRKDDIASALSANSITGGSESPLKTKMLLFNGLYYRGNWAYPFQELRKANVKEPFYVSSHKSMPVEMMRTHGRFQIGNLESLDSQAIVLPYENKRYSFVLIVPNNKDGLRKLIENIQPVDLQLLNTRLIDMDTSICLPKFEVEETSRSEPTLKKLGLKKIFSKYSADLGDINNDISLHVEEIVQHVNLRVDEGAASKNALTASNPLIDNKQLPRSDTIKDDEKSIMINRPFLYFVMDQINNFVIIAGKITAPEFIEEFGLADDN